MFDYVFDGNETGSIRDYLLNRGVMGTPFIKPGHIFFMAISFLLMGVNDYAPAIMMGIFGIGILYLIYRFGKEFLSTEVGLFASLILAVSGHFIFYSRSAYPQMDTVFFGLLGLYFYLMHLRTSTLPKKKYVWYSGISFAVGMLMHQSLAIPILILLLIDAVYIWQEKRSVKLIITSTYPLWSMILLFYGTVMVFSKLILKYFPQFSPRTALATL